jgi:hypothetical protein
MHHMAGVLGCTSVIVHHHRLRCTLTGEDLTPSLPARAASIVTVCRTPETEECRWRRRISRFDTLGMRRSQGWNYRAPD